MMGEPEVPNECGVCGDELDGEYHVVTYEVENPIESGYLNSYGVPGVFHSSPDFEPHELHLTTCKHCDAPETPPTPEEQPHIFELLESGFFALLLGAFATSPTATATTADIAFAACFSIVLGAVAIGEYLQIARIRQREQPHWEREWDVEPVLADDKSTDPVETAREEFLAGGIGEDELEERLDEELSEVERDRDIERVVER